MRFNDRINHFIHAALPPRIDAARVSYYGSHLTTSNVAKAFGFALI
jgi:hypothetical protein